jgi:Tfp pilus assembly protein PilO
MGLNSSLELSDLKKYKNKILGAFVIILALIISANINKIQNKYIGSLNAQKELEMKKSAEFEKINQLEKKNNFYKNFLAKKDSSLAINAITNIAKDLGVKIVSIRPDLEIKFQQYSRRPFEVSLTVDNYHELGSFIAEIEGLSDVYAIENLMIRSDSKNKFLTVTLRLSAVTVN